MQGAPRSLSTVGACAGGWGPGWGGLQQSIMIAGNFTALVGANGTWPDLDMLPLGPQCWNISLPGYKQPGADWTPENADRCRTILSVWTIARSPLMMAGRLPTDATTLGLLTNPVARALHERGRGSRVVSYAGNCTCKGSANSGACAMAVGGNDGAPCVVTLAAELLDLPESPSTPTGAATGAATAVCVVNLGEKQAVVETALSAVLPGAGGEDGPAGAASLVQGSYRRYDVWARVDDGPIGGGKFTTTLERHASALYLLRPPVAALALR